MENSSQLRQRRILLGKTMKEVADEVGVAEATVSRWESGNIGSVRGDRLLRYAAALDVPPAFITGEITEIPKEGDKLPDDVDDDIRIIARKMDRMTAKNRKKLMAIIDAMFDDDDDDIE